MVSGEDWEFVDAYGCDFLAFAVDIVAEIFLDSTHRDHGVVAKSLDHLQWGQEAVLVNALQDCV